MPLRALAPQSNVEVRNNEKVASIMGNEIAETRSDSQQPGTQSGTQRDAQGRPMAAGQQCDSAHWCPACDVEIAYYRFASKFSCPACGAVIKTQHECQGDEEGNCYDWLSKVDG
jgi:predicted RNA-binding Zn-ribbon protein involved in translation (DUF1610 family)